MPGGTAGRPLHDYWSSANFQAIRRSGGKIGALCLVCNKQLKNTARCRLKLHRNICPRDGLQRVLNTEVEALTNKQSPQVETLVNFKEETENSSNPERIEMENPNEESEKLEEMYVDYIQEEEDTEKETSELNSTNEKQNVFFTKLLSTSGQTFDSTVRQEKMTSPSPANTKIQKTNIDEALAEFFFGCNIPLTVADSIYFKKFIKTLNSSYTIPKTKYLLSDLLDKVFEKHNNIKQEIVDKSVETNSVLLLSGFNHSSGVIACLQTEDENRYFINYWDFDGEISGKSNTSVEELNGRLNQVAGILEECREMAKAMFNTKLYAAVFDGLEISTSLGFLLCTTCNGHEANQLARDIADPQLVGNIVEILKIFEKPELEAELIQNGGCRIVLPWAGKWCTYRETLHCFLKNFEIICFLISSKKVEVPDKIVDFVFNRKFITETRTYSEALDSICKLIYTCQKKRTTLAEATEEWLTLELPAKYEGILKVRKNAVLSPCAIAANFVDPRFRGKFLSEEQHDLMEDFFLEHLSAEGLDDLFIFKANIGIFKILSEKNILTPSTFWGLARRKHPVFSKLAKNLLNIPSSSSQLGKLFEHFSKVHMPVRNMSGLEKLRKLIKTYFSLRLKSANSE